MSVPEKPELNPLQPNPWQNTNGHHNQSIGTMADGSKAVGSAGRDVNFNEFNQFTLQAAERITSMFQLLPAVADFTGRSPELAQIEAAVTGADVAVPIVALSGMAGVGKSALALYAAHRLVARFPDGQLYVNLQGANLQGEVQPRDPLDVLGKWLKALGLEGGELPVALAARAELFRSLVAKQRVLMVLDNAHDEAQVRPLLPGGAGCAVLVTSRQGLVALAGVRGIPLSVLPAVDGLGLLTKLVGAERVAAERAAAAEIVGLCGGLPLAIRIAGGVLRGKAHWGLAADYLPLLKDEGQRLGQLAQVGGESVQASFSLSYRQLAVGEQAVLGVLGVLPGAFGLGMAAAVGELEAQAMGTSLERLVDAQLVEGLGEGRYRYHDLMRLYAKAVLGNEAVGAAEGRVFEWCCQGADYFENAFDPLRRRRLVAAQQGRAVDEAAEQAFVQVALGWFELERLNVLAVFAWGCTAKKHSEVVALAANVFDFFKTRGYWQDWEETHVGALAAARESKDLRGEGQTLNNLAISYRTQGRWSDAVAQYEQSLEIFRSLGDRQGEGQILNNLGNVYQAQGRWAEAIAQYEQSLEICRGLGDRHGEGQSLNNLGNVYQAQGRWADVIAQYEQSLEICRSLGDRQGEGQTLGNLGVVYKSQGRWADAIAQYEQSLEICRGLGDRHGEGQTLNNLGNVYQAQGRWADAIAQYEQSLEICRSLGDRQGEGPTLNNLGAVYQAQGRWADAIAQYEQSLEIKRSLGDRHGEGQTLNNLGNVYQAQGRWADAIAQYEQNLEIKRSLGDRQGEGQTLNNLGAVYQAQGRWADAIAQYEQSLEIKRSLGDRHGEGMTLMNLGNLHQARVQPYKANEYWQEALTKLHPDSPEAKRLTQQLNNPLSAISPKQFLIGCLPQIALLIFAAVNLFRGHWLLALLFLLTWASFVAIRLWRIRRGKPS